MVLSDIRRVSLEKYVPISDWRVLEVNNLLPVIMTLLEYSPFMGMTLVALNCASR